MPCTTSSAFDDVSFFNPSKQVLVVDARFVPLATIKSLLPSLIIAVPIEVVSVLMALSESTIWAKCDADKATFDPEFPQPKRYPELKRTVWNLTEVQEYLARVFSSPVHATPDPSAASRSSRRGKKVVPPQKQVSGNKRGGQP